MGYKCFFARVEGSGKDSELNLYHVESASEIEEEDGTRAAHRCFRLDEMEVVRNSTKVKTRRGAKSRGRFEIGGTFENHGKIVHSVCFMYGGAGDVPRPTEVASSGGKFARAWCEQIEHRLRQIEDVRALQSVALRRWRRLRPTALLEKSHPCGSARVAR